MKKSGQRYTKSEMIVIKAAFLEALKETGGLVTSAIKKVGLGSSKTIWLWRKQDPQFDEACKEAIAEATEMTLDLAESALLKNIKNGDIKAIKFYLACKGKTRGYDLKQEIDLNATITRPKVVFEGEEGTDDAL